MQAFKASILLTMAEMPRKDKTMMSLKSIAGAGYSLDLEVGKPAQNKETDKFFQLENRMKIIRQNLERSNVGVLLAQAALRFPNVASFSLSVSASDQYDDQGGSYVSYYVSANEVKLIEAVQDENIDELADEFASSLEIIFEYDSSSAWNAFQEPYEKGEFEVEVELDQLKDLIEKARKDKKPIQGIKVFNLLFPDVK